MVFCAKKNVSFICSSRQHFLYDIKVCNSHLFAPEFSPELAVSSRACMANEFLSVDTSMTCSRAEQTT
jgi:hypothetical protein